MFMKPFTAGIVLSITVAILAGCGTHNIPTDRVAPNNLAEKRISLFVDQDGTFYPKDWYENYEMKSLSTGQRKNYSVLKAAENKQLEKELREYEAEIIQSVSDRLASANRVFILIHGFNNDQQEAEAAFELIERKIDFKKTDEIIWFHWDGLVGSSVIGAGRIWNNATGFSQMAGIYGLRRILNVMHKKEIVVITHSRGASVFLSALSNPPFDLDFLDDTTWIDIPCAEPLQNNSNTVHALFLAPAIGRIDFGKTDYYEREKDMYRSLSAQLKEIHYTVNPKDPVLQKKFLPNNKFNPTGFGCDTNEAVVLQEHYKGKVELVPYPISMKEHEFEDYINSGQFQCMLKGLEKEMEK